MSRDLIDVTARLRRALCVTAGAMMLATVASAQAPPAEGSRWRLGAAVGSYVPFSALIRAADSNDTRLGAGPSFSLESQYLAGGSISAYAQGTLAFPTLRLGSSIRPAVVGPSTQVILAAATVGVAFVPDWFDSPFRPAFRVGGGLKLYSFDLAGTDAQLRPTGDVGLGFRGVGLGSVDVSAEVRFLPGSFDQSKLPTRGVAPQDQRQNDLVFAIGIGVRL